MNFEFMTIDTPLPPCMPFPRALTGFPVSSTAKVMYCRMLDAMLSKGQEDENGILFVCFPVTAIAAVLSRSSMTVKRSLNELETAGLIMRVRQGVGEPNRIYVLIPGKEDAALGGYDGSAYLFMLDNDGNITYTNQKDDIFFRNYSLLKHLKSDHAITEKEFDSLNKKIAEGKKGVELLGKDEPYYLGYCPIESNNTMLICIVKKATVDNVLKEYQKTIGLTTMLMTGFIILLFAGLFYSISRFSIANQKVKFEKRNNELQAMAISEMEEANKNLKRLRTLLLRLYRPLKMQIRQKQIFYPICRMIFAHL